MYTKFLQTRKFPWSQIQMAFTKYNSQTSVCLMIKAIYMFPPRGLPVEMPGSSTPDGKVFRIASDGTCEMFCEGLYQTNGLAIRRGEATLYVIQSVLDNVLRLEIKLGGKLGKSSIYAGNLDGLPDGMAFTESGDLLVVTGMHEIIYRVQLNGSVDIFVEDRNAEKLVTPANPAFGGANFDELYITNLMRNSVSRIKGMPRGQKLYYQ